MRTKHLHQLKNFFKFTLLFGAVAFLSYCTTSPKTASNFGKRKYTHGHFSDPVAKVKMEYKPSAEPNLAPTTHANPSENTANNLLVKPSDKNNSKPTFTAKATNSVTPSGNRPKQEAGTIAKNESAASANNNISLKVNSGVSAYPYVEQGHPYEHGGGDRSSGLLVAWLLALGVSVLCYLLLIAYAASAASGTSVTAGVGCFLVIFGTFAFIAAIVLFILWIIAISR